MAVDSVLEPPHAPDGKGNRKRQQNDENEFGEGNLEKGDSPTVLPVRRCNCSNDYKDCAETAGGYARPSEPGNGISGTHSWFPSTMNFD
jgi:hypothetical protein